MMTVNDYIVFTTASLAAAVALIKSPSKAFVNIYLPSLLLVPWFVILSGCCRLPQFSASEAAIIAIFIIYAFLHGTKWRFSLTDMLLLCFFCCSTFSTYRHEHDFSVNNYITRTIVREILPYLMAKALIEPEKTGDIFIKKLTQISFFTAAIAIPDYFLTKVGSPRSMTMNLFAPWVLFQPTGVLVHSIAFGPRIPRETMMWRWGFKRVASFTEHPTDFGMILSIACIFYQGSKKNGFWHWKNYQKLVYFIFLAVIFMTTARGTWLGLIGGILILVIGRSQKRLKRTLWIAAFLIPLIAGGVAHYATMNRKIGYGISAAEETGQWRIGMIKAYTPVAIHGGAWGSGDSSWVPFKDYQNINLQYLFIWVRFGWLGLFSWLAIYTWVGVRLLIRAVQTKDPKESRFAFMLLAVESGILATFMTTNMKHNQVLALLAMTIGWAEGFLLKPQEAKTVETDSLRMPTAKPFHFKKLLT